MLLGVDTGGTFTDFALLSESGVRIHKVLSTPSAPEQAILQGIAELGLNEAVANGQLTIIHGSTVATNAALEGKGARTVLITNRGFGDLLTIGRQTRRELYNLQPTPTQPPVPRELCLETGGRLGANGETVEPLSEADLAALREQLAALNPESVAINLLFSFLDPEFEQAIESIVPESIFCSRSSFVLPEYKEYERGIATWLNARLGPLVQHYLERLKQGVAPSPVSVMQSSGGTIEASQAGLRAVNMLLSGPAGGLAAAEYMARLTEQPRLMTFDMGGTSTDVALVDGGIQLTNEGRIGDYPVAVPMVDMHTIGAGGGSIAYLDEGGLLQVGPESAGADPGPACYGKGGTRPTVTDANALLGRLRPEAFLGGSMSLDLAAAERAINTIAQPLGLSAQETAEGILAIANEHMTRALRVISVQRGHDPRDFTLCCFGGAGGLHICALAEAMNMQRAMIPVHGGVLSAFGMLVAPKERQLSQTLCGPLHTFTAATIGEKLDQLREQGSEELLEEGVDPTTIESDYRLDLRYVGQSYTLSVPWMDAERSSEAFHAAHQQRYGHRLELPIELVNLRVALTSATQTVELPTLAAGEAPSAEQSLQLPGIDAPVAVIPRASLAAEAVVHGPALITETVSTTLIASGWQARCDHFGNLRLSRD